MHGNISSFGSANGISVVALADFGKPGVGGVDGSSGATGKSSSDGSASINNDEDEIKDDDLLALLEGDEDAERSPKNTDKSDMYGKTLKTAVARVQNSGSVSGSITARAQQLKRPLNKNSYTPQFYDVSLITSGNGVSMANYIETPDKYTYSQEKQNYVHLDSLDNSGNMRGQATLEGGTRTTHTYTKSKGSGNGVSLFASTGLFAKNATRVALDNINNDGHISGQIRQISGNNSGYNSPHMMSGSEATGSGNGISLYSDTFNAQIPRVETRLGKINNRGSIRGDAYLKAGDGSGDLSIDARAKRLRQPKPRRAQQAQRHQRLRRRQIHPAPERPPRLGAESHPRLQPPENRQRQRKRQRRPYHRQPRHQHRGHRHRPRPHLQHQSRQRLHPAHRQKPEYRARGTYRRIPDRERRHPPRRRLGQPVQRQKRPTRHPQRRGKILSLGTKPTSPAQRGSAGRANKTHRDRINPSPHQQPETSMKKTKILYLAALLGGCAANSGINQNTLARELISPLVKQQCHSQLNARQEWQLASALMGAEIKQQWENKICGCVSEEAPSQMSGEEMIQVINPATRSQAVTNVAVKTVSACFNRIMSR